MAHTENLLIQFSDDRSDKDTPMPKLLTEEDFLPRRVRRKKLHRQQAQQEKSNYEKLASVMNSLCGFG